MRRFSTDTGSCIEHLRDRIELVSGDLLDQTFLLALSTGCGRTRSTISPPAVCGDSS
jgi:hypothetical protein